MELKEVDTTKLSASLGLELEVFYKELQSRLKSQYDLEDWRQRRAKMALKRQGLLNLDGRNCQKYLPQTKADFLTLIMLHKLTQSL